MNSEILDVEDKRDYVEETKIILDFYRKLDESQIDIDPEIAKIIQNINLFDLL